VSNDPESLQDRVDELEREVAVLRWGQGQRTVRRRSGGTFLGIPVWEVALGPDPENNEAFGHARAIVAIGDVATGVIAIGGVALGGITIGGCSIGLLAALGGLAVGTLALGGAAIGLIAFGGGAVGYVAIGGGAFGHYACGAGALGEHVISVGQRDPEAVKFFSQWFPWVL
jgi:hypothetical protein